jgi:hypothetical protein
MRYDGYTTKERLDDILDKISKYGIESITNMEMEFLDSYSYGGEEEVHQKLIKREYETIFEDDQGYFRFELTDMKKNKDSVTYCGVLYAPDLKMDSGEIITGRLVGKIIIYDSDLVVLDFNIKKKKKIIYDIFDFCDGIEQELDSFIDYVILELKSSI